MHDAKACEDVAVLVRLVVVDLACARSEDRDPPFTLAYLTSDLAPTVVASNVRRLGPLLRDQQLVTERVVMEALRVLEPREPAFRSAQLLGGVGKVGEKVTLAVVTIRRRNLHHVGTSSVGSGHGPGVLAHSRGLADERW